MVYLESIWNRLVVYHYPDESMNAQTSPSQAYSPISLVGQITGDTVVFFSQAR
jgi:hypothetical protein